MKYNACIHLTFAYASLCSANKFWSGLLRSYYLPRASTYFSYLSRSLQQNTDFALEKWRMDWISYSNNWQEGTEVYPTKAAGNSIAISKALLEKYFSWFHFFFLHSNYGCKINKQIAVYWVPVISLIWTPNFYFMVRGQKTVLVLALHRLLAPHKIIWRKQNLFPPCTTGTKVLGHWGLVDILLLVAKIL